jgi:hypothetical protein
LSTHQLAARTTVASRVEAKSANRSPAPARPVHANRALAAEHPAQRPLHQFANLSLDRSSDNAPPPNRTGLPDRLKAGIEQLSGFAMDDVRVHYNSPKPAAVQALAYSKGTEIHVGPGQEQHLPHEAWHVVQQKQGRVKPTLQMKGVAINDDDTLELEADTMGAAAAMRTPSGAPRLRHRRAGGETIQRRAGIEYETSVEVRSEPLDPAKEEDKKQIDAAVGFVEQDTIMLESKGWNIVSDNSKMEFVTEPPVEADDLANIVAHMTGVLAKMRGPLNQTAKMETLLGLKPKKEYWVLPYTQGAITGAMQGTVGIPFPQLFAFFKLLTEYKLEADDSVLNALKKQYTALNSDEKADQKAKDQNKAQLAAVGRNRTALRSDQIEIFKKISAQVVQVTSGLEKEVKDSDELLKLRGLLHFVGQYASFAAKYKPTERASYVKKSFPVMARTSFHSMYRALDKASQGSFLKAAETLLDQLGIDRNKKAFGDNAEKLAETAQFTVQNWLTSINEPKWRVLSDNRLMESDLMTAPGASRHATDASMGALELEEEDDKLVVVELRHIKHSTGTHLPASIAAFVRDLAHLGKVGKKELGLDTKDNQHNAPTVAAVQKPVGAAAAALNNN